MSQPELIEEDQLRKAYFELAGTILIVLDTEGRVQEINNKGCRLVGEDRSALIGKNWFKTFLPKREQIRVLQAFKRQITTKTRTTERPFENFIKTADGTERCIAWVTDLVFGESGNVISTINSGYDITEQRNQQEELRKFRAIIDNSSDHILVVDPETVSFIDFNETAIRELGYSREELFKLGPAGIKPNLDKEDLKNKFVEILASKEKSGQIISKHQRKDGSILDVEINLRALLQGDRYYLLSIARDVTERTRYESIIRELNTQVSHRIGVKYLRSVSGFLCKVFKQEQCIIGTYQPDGELLHTMAYSIKGRMVDNEELTFSNNPIADAFPNSKIINRKTDLKILQNFKLFKELDISNYAILPLREEDNSVIGYVILVSRNSFENLPLYTEILQIIGSRCQSEMKELLRERALENKTRELEFKNRMIEASLSPIVTTDLKGIIHYVNPAFINTWLYKSCKEIVGKNVECFFKSNGEATAYLQKVSSNSGWKGELKGLRSDKSEFDLLINATSMKNDDGEVQYIMASFVDITERKENERLKENLAKDLEQKVTEKTKELEANQKMYKLISQNMTDLVTICDPEGKLTFSSPSVKEILGYEVTEILGSGMMDFVHSDDQEEVCDKVKRVTEDKQQAKMECRVRCCSGEYLWVETIIKGIFDEQSQLVQIQTSSRDITKRKKAEEALIETLEKERHLGLLKSRFVSMASHQFRTPLTVIQSNIELLNMQAERIQHEAIQSKFDKISTRIQRETSRMTDMMNDVLILGKINSDEMTRKPELVDMIELIEEFKDQTEFLENGSKELDVIVKGKPEPIETDRTQIGHALMNLISNAFKYSSNIEENPVVQLDFTKEERVQISITDKGIGIPENEISQVFEAFHRGSNVGGLQGTGLGLNIVKEYIELNGGAISVQSQLNQGACFNIELPKNRHT